MWDDGQIYIVISIKSEQQKLNQNFSTVKIIYVNSFLRSC